MHTFSKFCGNCLVLKYWNFGSTLQLFDNKMSTVKNFIFYDEELANIIIFLLFWKIIKVCKIGRKMMVYKEPLATGTRVMYPPIR